MTFTVQQVADRLRRIFGDDDGVQIKDSDIIAWVNSAQNSIATDNEELLETVASADIVVGQADYSQPADLDTLRSLMYNNFRLRGLSFAQFNEYLDGFKAQASQGGYGNGNPEVYMVYGGTITLFPAPNKSITGGLKIYYSKFPPTVSTLADNLGVPDGYFKPVLDFCLKQAYEMDENLWMVEMKGQDYEQAIQKLKGREKLTSNEYYPSITTLPEDDLYLDSGGFYG